MTHSRLLTLRRPLDDAACDSARCDTTRPDATRPALGLAVDSQETLDGGSYDLDPQEMPGGLESRPDLPQENLAAAVAVALPPTATSPPFERPRVAPSDAEAEAPRAVVAAQRTELEQAHAENALLLAQRDAARAYAQEAAAELQRMERSRHDAQRLRRAELMRGKAPALAQTHAPPLPPQQPPSPPLTPSRQPPNFRPGDWMCPACNNHNHAYRAACFRCSLPRPATSQRFGTTQGVHAGAHAARGGAAAVRRGTAAAGAAGAADAPRAVHRRVLLLKQDASERTGIRLGGSAGAPAILQLTQGSAGDRHLEVGEKIFAINGEEVDGHEHGTQLLRSAVGRISLEVEPADVADPAHCGQPLERDLAHSWQTMLQTAGQAHQGGRPASKPAAPKPAASKPAASKPAASKPAASKLAAPKPAAPEAHSAAADTLEAWLKRQPGQQVVLSELCRFYDQYAAAGQTVKHRGIRPFAADHGQRFLVTGAGHAMAIRAASSHRAGDEERRHDQDGQLYTKVEFIGEYGGVLEWEQAAKPSSKQALATPAKSAKGAPASKAAPAAAASKDEHVLATGVRILHAAKQPVLLSKFFQKLYLELGAEAKEAVQKRGGAVKWLKSVSTHLLLHKGAGVGDEAVSLQPRTSAPAWAAYLE